MEDDRTPPALGPEPNAALELRRDELLARLAHELREPLSPLTNAGELIRRECPSSPRLQRAAGIIARQTRQMKRMVDDLLDLSRMSRGAITLEQETLDLGEVVRAVVDDHRLEVERAQLHVSLDVPEDPVWIQGDATRLAQAVGNVLHNATKFTDRGGRVRVQLGVEHGRARLVVRDTGVGIRPELLARVFEPFHQDEPAHDHGRGGLGLGLALVRGLVGLHGGTATATSAGVGRGAELVIELPLREDRASAAAAGDSAAPGPSVRVLVIEDNVDAAESMAALLELFGHSVEIAHDGSKGLEKVRASRPDVVFCDIGLPGALDGYGVAERLRTEPGRAPFLIALTGYGLEEDRARALAAGFDLHVTKPIAPAALERAVLAAREARAS